MKKILLTTILTITILSNIIFAYATDENLETNYDFDLNDIESDYISIQYLDAETTNLFFSAVKTDWSQFFEYSTEENDNCDWDPILIAEDMLQPEYDFIGKNNTDEDDPYETYFPIACKALGKSHGIDFNEDDENHDRCVKNLNEYEFIMLYIENHDNTRSNPECTITVYNLNDAFGDDCGPYLHFYTFDKEDTTFENPIEITDIKIGIIDLNTIAIFTETLGPIMIVYENADATW